LERGEAIGMHVLAIAAHESGDLDKARPLYEQALKRARTIDDAWFLSVATNNLGTLHSSEGDYARAAELFEESLAIGEALGDLDRRARQLCNLGSVKYELGDKDAAIHLYRRALAAAFEIGTVMTQCQSLSGIAVCEAEAGNVVDAAHLVGRRDTLISRIGLVEDDDGQRERTVAMIAAALGHDRLAAELAIGAALSPKETLDLALGQNESPTPS
jgi:tetratricopeptide (TPR) repeat protein